MEIKAKYGPPGTKFGTSRRNSKGELIPGETNLRDGNAAAEERARQHLERGRQLPTPQSEWDQKFTPVSQSPRIRNLGPGVVSTAAEAAKFTPSWVRTSQEAFAHQPLTLQTGNQPASTFSSTTTPSTAAIQPSIRPSDPAWVHDAYRTSTGFVTSVPGTSSGGAPRTAAFTPTGEQALEAKYGQEWQPKPGETIFHTTERRRRLLQGSPAPSRQIGEYTGGPTTRHVGGGVTASNTTAGTVLNFPKKEPYSPIQIPEQYRVAGASPVATTRMAPTSTPSFVGDGTGRNFAAQSNAARMASSSMSPTEQVLRAAVSAPTIKASEGLSTPIARSLTSGNGGDPWWLKTPLPADNAFSLSKPQPKSNVPWYLQPQEFSATGANQTAKANVGAPSGSKPTYSPSPSVAAATPITSGAASVPGVGMPKEKPWQPKFSVDSTVQSTNNGPSLSYSPENDETLKRRPNGLAAL